jgi:hypothetical protein
LEIAWWPYRAVVVVLAALQASQFLCNWLLKTKEARERWCVVEVIPSWSWAIAWVALFLVMALEGSYRVVDTRAKKHRAEIDSVARTHARALEAVARERDRVNETLGQIEAAGGDRFAESMRAIESIYDTEQWPHRFRQEKSCR